MVLVTARVEVSPPSRRELLQVLLHSAQQVRWHPGALSAHVYEDLETATVVCLESRWSTRGELEAHVRSQTFGSLLGAVELLGTRSKVVWVEGAEDRANPTITLRELRDTIREACGST